MQFDGLPPFIHRDFCAWTAVFPARTKPPGCATVGGLCVQMVLPCLLGGFGGGVAILGTLGSGLGQGGIGVIQQVNDIGGDNRVKAGIGKG